MQSLLRPCCLSYFSSLFVCVVVGLAAHSCFAMQHLRSSSLALHDLPCSPTFPHSLQEWPGLAVKRKLLAAHPPSREDEASAWEMVSSKEEAFSTKEEPTVESID